MTSSSARSRELSEGLDRTRDRIAAAAAAAGRSAATVTLVVVTKDHPVSDLRLLADLGVVDVGESRQQQIRDKQAELAADAGRLRWHAIGRLQRNKARAVGRAVDVVHSLDDARLLGPLAAGVAERDRQLDCLVQVSLDGDPTRGGVVPDEVPALAEAVAAHEQLRMRGVMAVAPMGVDAARAFESLAGVSQRVRRDHPEATWISAGMSGDLEAAVAAGATHVRVGTAVLGSRPSPR